MVEEISLKCLRDDIEKMDSIHQKRIFDILQKSKIDYTKNTNGIFINMSLLSKEIIEEIKSYIIYVELQQQQLNKVEEDKKLYKQKYYNKDNKEKEESIVSLQE
mgnify:FL=1